MKNGVKKNSIKWPEGKLAFTNYIIAEQEGQATKWTLPKAQTSSPNKKKRREPHREKAFLSILHYFS